MKFAVELPEEPAHFALKSKWAAALTDAVLFIVQSARRSWLISSVNRHFTKINGDWSPTRENIEYIPFVCFLRETHETTFEQLFLVDFIRAFLHGNRHVPIKL